MPELPDLVHVQSVLSRSVCGQAIVGARIGDPVVLRIMVAVPFPALLLGQSIRSITRRGQFLDFALDNVHLVVNAMRATPSAKSKTATSPSRPSCAIS
jgi:formamidopyrimidine-DNA glycosylase